MDHQHIPARHLLVALAVVAVWGSNFSVIKVALDDLPPLFFATLRFAFAFFPMALFLPRPKVPLRELAAYGVLIGAGQFGLLYIALRGDVTPGLASLVLQMQVFFTIGLSMALTGERVRLYQAFALGLAVAGIILIAVRTGGDTTLLGLALCLGAAFSWACGNIVSRRAQDVNMLAYVVWASVFAVPPLLLLSLLFEGPADIRAGVGAAGVGTWLAVAYQSAGNTMFGYGAWGWLLSHHPAATITPTALLVPVFGMAVAWMFLDEAPPSWKLVAAEHGTSAADRTPLTCPRAARASASSVARGRRPARPCPRIQQTTSNREQTTGSRERQDHVAPTASTTRRRGTDRPTTPPCALRAGRVAVRSSSFSVVCSLLRVVCCIEGIELSRTGPSASSRPRSCSAWWSWWRPRARRRPGSPGAARGRP